MLTKPQDRVTKEVELTVRYSPVQIDWNSARNTLKCQFRTRNMAKRVDIGRLLQHETESRKHPFRLTYSLQTDLGNVELTICRRQPSSVTVCAVLTCSQIQQVWERVRSSDKIEKAVCAVLRETGISQISEFRQVSCKTHTAAGGWVEERYGKSCSTPCPYTSPPLTPFPLVQAFTIQPILAHLKQC